MCPFLLPHTQNGLFFKLGCNERDSQLGDFMLKAPFFTSRPSNPAYRKISFYYCGLNWDYTYTKATPPGLASIPFKSSNFQTHL